MGLCVYKNAWFENDIKLLYYILNKEWDHCETGWSRCIHAHNVMVFTHAAHWSSNHVLTNEKFSTSPAEQIDMPINIPTPVVLIAWCSWVWQHHNQSKLNCTSLILAMKLLICPFSLDLSMKSDVGHMLDWLTYQHSEEGDIDRKQCQPGIGMFISFFLVAVSWGDSIFQLHCLCQLCQSSFLAPITLSSSMSVLSWPSFSLI